MKQLPAIICFWFVALSLQSQTPYGYEWINYSQQYARIPIYKEGVYRVDATLLNSYFNVSTIDPNNLQLFLMGKEQPLYIRGEADGQIDPGDYLEFYANPDMSLADSLLYRGAAWLPNRYAPLFNDTVYAFLTLSTQTGNKRFVREADTASLQYPLTPFFYTYRVFAPQGNYNAVNEFPYDVSDPNYSQAEGKGQAVDKGNSIASSFGPLGLYSSANLPAHLLLHYSGNSVSNNLNTYDHHITAEYSDVNGNAAQVADTLFRGFTAVRKRVSINAQTLGNNSNVTLRSLADPAFAGFSNSTLLHYARLDYPHTTNLANANSMWMNMNNVQTAAKQSFHFTGLNLSPGDSVILYDVANGKKIPATLPAPQQALAVVPNGAFAPSCYLVSGSAVIQVTTVSRVSPSGYFTNYAVSNATAPYLLVYPGAFETSAMEYKNYRQSPAGGGYQVIAAPAEELYQQFAWGINKHPLSIRNFCRLMWDNLPNRPQYVFLLGKGVSPANLNAAAQAVNFIPAMGVPASDNLITASLSPSGSAYVPDLPIGRLAAITDNEVRLYLTKVQQQEGSGQQDWKKRVLHFVGGDTPELANTLGTYMDAYAGIVRDTLFGAEVLTFKKNTTAPIQTNISDSIQRALSRGASLLTFFGHGSEQGFDQAIDDPDQYNNQGRYPLVIANSCYSGDIHVPTRRSVSERFVFSNQKGSVGFLAATSYGFVYALNVYTGSFYKALSATHYNKGVGDMVRQACITANSIGDPITRFTGLDMTLNGDPALRLSNGTQPDYQLKNSDLFFDLKKYSDSVGVTIYIKNAGKAPRDSFFVKLDRVFPSGDSSTIYRRMAAPMFKDSLRLFMPIDFDRGIGLNRFRVKLDAFNEISESNELNNSTLGTVDLFIPGGDILPVFPYKFAVVANTPTLALKASTSDPFAPRSGYRFQLDTSDSFRNPLQSAFMESTGGVLQWTVSLPYGDSTVYFWRVSRDSTGPNKPYLWKESSFQVIGQKSGWGQAHFHQFKNNGYRFVNYNRPQRKFVFQNSKQSLFCRNSISAVGTDIVYALNNIIRSTWGCGPNGWNIAVFDSISGEPQVQIGTGAGVPGTYNNCVCGDNNQVLPYYSFGAANYCNISTWKADLENFLNLIAPNHHVLAFTIGAISTPTSYAEISSYSNSMYSAFESIGAVNIRNITDTVPYILFGRKGMSAGQGHEVVGSNRQSVITLTDSMETRWNSGYIASPQIGPAYKWNSLHWRVGSLDNAPGDTTRLKLVGIKANGSADTLGSFPTDTTDVLNLGNYVDANIYPYLKLVAFMKDNANRTSPQLKRWQVLYEEVPECALDPRNGYVALKDTLSEGDEVAFIFPISNIGQRNFADSLVVTYWIEDNNRNKQPLPQRMKKKGFAPGEILMDTLRVSSYQLSGNNALWLYVNPLQHPRYQKEQEQFNNIGRVPFRVEKDITNPLMDVTFDGIRILNGDIVSSRPNILITLHDENKFLALNDTAAFSIFLQAPGQAQQRVYFAQGLEFTPASLPKNMASISYRPALPVDGRYTLIVQAHDRSRNASGTQDYRIQFEISNKPTVTNVINYPNPFTTSTRFVFTLTGSEVPEVFTIQIMTISGKIVREITRSELGFLHIGRNITEYAWDGRDDFGDRLATGVYLYRVLTKLNGQNIEKAASGADKYITREFGKMVLMR